MNIKQLIEEINKLTEDELVDDFEDTDLDKEDLQAIDSVGTTKKLDAKTKISRALDVLKAAIEDFKNTTVEEVDLVNDADLVACFESLDQVANRIAEVLDGKKEEPVEEKPVGPTEVEEEEEEIEEIEEPEEVEEEPEDEDIDFEAEAELDLFGEEE